VLRPPRLLADLDSPGAWAADRTAAGGRIAAAGAPDLLRVAPPSALDDAPASAPEGPTIRERGGEIAIVGDPEDHSSRSTRARKRGNDRGGRGE